MIDTQDLSLPVSKLLCPGLPPVPIGCCLVVGCPRALFKKKKTNTKNNSQASEDLEKSHLLAGLNLLGVEFGQNCWLKVTETQLKMAVKSWRSNFVSAQCADVRT